MLALLGLLVGAAAFALALHSPGAPNAPGLADLNTQRLAHIAVPVDRGERRWRSWIRKSESGTIAPRQSFPGIRREIERHVALSGATLVRLRIWRTPTISPSVELVVATAAAPAVFLKNDLQALNGGIHARYRFVEIVDRHGRKYSQEFTWRIVKGGLIDGGRDYMKPRLRGCIPFVGWGSDPFPPCPAP